MGGIATAKNQETIIATVNGCNHKFKVIGECPNCEKVIVICLGHRDDPIPYNKTVLDTNGKKIPPLEGKCPICARLKT